MRAQQRALSRLVLSGKETIQHHPTRAGRHREFRAVTSLVVGKYWRATPPRGGYGSVRWEHVERATATTTTPTATTTLTTTTKQKEETLHAAAAADVHVESIIGRRREMEDGHCILRRRDGDDNTGKMLLAAVFDGHGGAQVASFLQTEFPNYFWQAAQEDQLHNDDNDDNDDNDSTESSSSKSASPSSSSSSCVRILKSCLHRLDETVVQQKEWNNSGATAVVAWLQHHPSPSPEQNSSKRRRQNPSLIVANVGDSRAVLGRIIVSVATNHSGQLEEKIQQVKAVQLTRDHLPDDPDEKYRIEQVLGGKVKYSLMDSPRVQGLSLSRSIGSVNQRPYVSPEPEFTIMELLGDNSGDDDNDDSASSSSSSSPLLQQHEFVVLACDGLFEARGMKNQHVVDFVGTHWKRGTPRSEIPKELTKYALARGSRDNITVIIMWVDNEENYRR